MNDPAPVAAPQAPGAAPVAANDDCALVVAISNYTEFMPLRGPEPDAVQFCTWLREKGGLKDENIRLVHADEQGKPIINDIRDGLMALKIRDKKRRGRRLYFYYAGHGIGPTFNEVGIVPADAGSDTLVDACLGINYCINLFIETGFFDEVVVFMDCCREREYVETIALPFKFEKRFEDAIEKVNHFTLFGAGDDGKSFDIKEITPADEIKYRGLMTKYLLEGLNGAPGAIDAQNKVTSLSLANFVYTKVQAEAKDRALPQMIDKPKPPEHEIVFYTVPEDQIPTTEIRLIVGPQTAGQHVIIQNTHTNFTITESPRPEGAVIVAKLKGNARYQLMLPGRQPVIVDPASLPSDPADVQLP